MATASKAGILLRFFRFKSNNNFNENCFRFSFCFVSFRGEVSLRLSADSRRGFREQGGEGVRIELIEFLIA